MKKRVSRLVGMFWRQVLAYAVAVATVGGVLWFRLGTLVPGFSAPELLARADVNSFQKLIDNPIFLPHKALQYILLRFDLSSAFWMRSVSALFGIIIILVFFDIVRSWYSQRVALLSTFLLLIAAWFLHFARLGTPEIMFAGSIGLLWIGMKLKSHRSPRARTIFASIIIIIGSLYIPGLAWLIIPLLVWQRKLVMREFSKIPRLLAVVTVLLVIIGLAPLAYGLVRHPELLRDWLLIPQQLTPGQWWSNAWHLPLWLTLRGPAGWPVYWLGSVPLLNAFSLVMLVLGAYLLAHYRTLDRVRAIAAIILLGCILAAFNGPVALTIALPLIFVVIAAGVALLLQQWFTIFPRNPLARNVGVIMVCLVIGLASYYNLRHYFVAWPRNHETQQVFPAGQQ